MKRVCKMEKEENGTGSVCWKVDDRGSLCLLTDRCKGCGFCIEFCPVKALEVSDKTTPKGYYPPVMKGGCVLCGRCEKMCPDFAIYVKKEEEE